MSHELTRSRRRYCWFLLWLACTCYGCVMPDGSNYTFPGNMAASTAAADDAVAVAAGTVPESGSIPVRIRAESFDAQYDKIPPSFLSAVPAGLDLVVAEDDEVATVVFQTGHAAPESVSGVGSAPWEVVPDGTLYLAQAMCQTMAHGPASTCNNTSVNLLYSCPGEWKPQTADSVDHRNVYDRWGIKYFDDNAATRMVCGDSTIYIPTEAHAVQFWDFYGKAKYYVSDAFLAALSQDAVSICLTKGGEQPTESPIWQDKVFVAEQNSFPNTHYHILYSKPYKKPYENEPTTYSYDDIFGKPEENDEADVALTEGQMQSHTTEADIALINELAALPIDDPERAYGLVLDRILEEKPHYFPRCLPTVLTDEKPADTLVPLGEQLADDLFMAGNEDEYFATQSYAPGQAGLEAAMIQAAAAQLDSLGVAGQPGGFVPDFVSGRHMLLAIIPVEAGLRETESTLTYRNSLVTFRRQIDLDALQTQTDEDRERIPIIKELLLGDGHAPVIYSIGAGGLVTVQLNQDITPLSAFVIRHELTQVGAWLDVKSPGTAYVEALQQLESSSPVATQLGELTDESEPAQQPYINPFVLDVAEEALHPDRPYRLVAWRWGFLEGPASTHTQSELVVRYEFEFVPKFEDLPLTPVLQSIEAPSGALCSW